MSIEQGNTREVKVFFDFTMADPNTSRFTGRSGDIVVTPVKDIPLERMKEDEELKMVIGSFIQQRFKRLRLFDLKITKIEPHAD